MMEAFPFTVDKSNGKIEQGTKFTLATTSLQQEHSNFVQRLLNIDQAQWSPNFIINDN